MNCIKTVNLKADIVIGFGFNISISYTICISPLRCGKIVRLAGLCNAALGFIKEAVSGKLRVALSPLGKEDPLVSHHVSAFQS